MDKSRSGLSQTGLRDWVSVLWGSHRVQRERILACRHQVEVYISGWAHSHLTAINGGYLPVSTFLKITCRDIFLPSDEFVSWLHQLAVSPTVARSGLLSSVSTYCFIRPVSQCHLY